MQCQLCKTYHTAERVQEKVRIGKDKEMVIINRYCANVDRIVNEEDDGCEKFSPARFFWCRGWESWVSVETCQHRQNKDKYRTCPCSLGLEVRGIEPPKKLIKKKLVIRKPKKKLLVIRGNK